MRKTVQAIKISASWTPKEEEAEGMALAAFGASDTAARLRIAGGRILLRYAIAVEHADPDHMVRVSERIREIKDVLVLAGTLHRFTTQAGAVPAELAEHLPETEQDGTEPDEAREAAE